jgi:hypothetical protein
MDAQRSQFAAPQLAVRAKRRETSSKFLSTYCTRSVQDPIQPMVVVNFAGALGCQIFCFLHPRDLLRLSWCNKFLCAVLISKSSRFVWTAALSTIEDLPDCPQDLTEIAYSHLLFHPYCCVRLASSFPVMCGHRTQTCISRIAQNLVLR